jgi:hypothetical protein
MSLFSSPSTPDLPVAPVVPSTSDTTAQKNLEEEKKRLRRAQGIESTDLSGSMGILGTPFPGLKNTFG